MFDLYIWKLLYYRNVKVFPSGKFGSGSSSIMMDDLHCTGKESHIASCTFNGWEQHNCQHSEDVSISCGE